MSTEWFLYSKSLKRKAWIGTINIAAAWVYDNKYGAMDFVKYSIDNGTRDVILVDENHPDFEYDENNNDPVPDWHKLPLV